jgi:hypothetical protein
MSLSFHYEQAPIPRFYRGVRYKSSLESYWASYFDVLGWEHEYEPPESGPLNLKGWLPDFWLASYRTLVEAKPIWKMDPPVADKLVRAANGAGYKGNLLIVGHNPLCDLETDEPYIGWINRGRPGETVRFRVCDFVAWPLRANVPLSCSAREYFIDRLWSEARQAVPPG